MRDKRVFSKFLPCSQSNLTVKIPGGVLRYISDGDVRSPFLGLKFAI